MNKISFLTVALLLLVSVSATYPPWTFTKTQEKAIKKLMKRTQDPVNKLCMVGWHKMSTWSLDQWGFSSGCVRNDTNCGNFDLLTGHCKKCKWSNELKKDATYGDWCYVTWYAWLYFYMLLFFGIALLVLTILAIKSCCTKKRSYNQMQDGDGHELVNQHSYEEEHGYGHNQNPYHH